MKKLFSAIGIITVLFFILCISSCAKDEATIPQSHEESSLTLTSSEHIYDFISASQTETSASQTETSASQTETSAIRTETSAIRTETSQIPIKTLPPTSAEKSSELSYHCTITIFGLDRNLILSEHKMHSNKEMTVFSATKEILEKNKIDFQYSGFLNMVYVKSINGLSEFDYGGSSGWIYRVNNSTDGCGVGCGQRKIADGDSIQWYYIRSIGDKI